MPAPAAEAPGPAAAPGEPAAGGAAASSPAAARPPTLSAMASADAPSGEEELAAGGSSIYSHVEVERRPGADLGASRAYSVDLAPKARPWLHA